MILHVTQFGSVQYDQDTNRMTIKGFEFSGTGSSDGFDQTIKAALRAIAHHLLDEANTITRNTGFVENIFKFEEQQDENQTYSILM